MPGLGPSIVAAALGVLTMTGPSGQPLAADAAAEAELASTGAVRIALVEAPNAGAFFVGRGPDGAPRGVTADLGESLARALGCAAAFRVFPNSGEATEATRTGAVDVAFMPVDEARRAAVAFGPPYYRLESTYLVLESSGVTDVNEVDRPGFRVVGIANTTTIRASARSLTKTQPFPATSVAEAVEMVKTGRADAIALSRDSLGPILREIPGSRIVTGAFQQTSVSVAVPKDRPAALTFVTQWLEDAKRSGAVGGIFARHGLGEQAVAE